MGVNLQTELAPRHKSGLLLRNPVMTASGTFGYGFEYAKIAEIHRLGAIVCKSTTLHANKESIQAPPVESSLRETSSGLLSAYDLANPGIRRVIRKYAPQWANWQTPVIVSIAGETIEEFVELAERLEGVEGVAAIELNSAPLGFEGVGEATAKVRQATTLPLIVKLSPASGDIPSLALAAVAGGADGVSLVNALAGLSINIHTRKLALGQNVSGLSGPAIKPIALRMVYEVARELRKSGVEKQVPIIGIGGISNAQDALEYLMAGASAIQVGTMNFVNPHVGVEIVEGIEEFLEREEIKEVGEIVGAIL